MESPQKQNEIAGKLTFAEIQRIRGIIQQLENLIDHPEITEERFHDMTNAQSEIIALREIYLIRLMAIFKRGYVINP